jgi:hypothetical protein
VRIKIKTSVVLERARSLVNTSVQDMQSGLWGYKTREDLRVLALGLIYCRQRGEKTKVKMLEAKIKRLREGVLKP